MVKKLLKTAAVLAGCFSAVGAAAEVISGEVIGWQESTYFTFGDGVNDLSVFWSINTNNLGWFYGSQFGNNAVAHADGVTHISQITDASAFSLGPGYIGPLADADASPTGVGAFVIWRSNANGHYGVLRIDDIVGNGLDATLSGAWWFQTDGSASFAQAIPEPQTYLLMLVGLGLVAGVARSGKRLRARQ